MRLSRLRTPGAAGRRVSATLLMRELRDECTEDEDTMMPKNRLEAFHGGGGDGGGEVSLGQVWR